MFHTSVCILFKLKAYGISGNVWNWIMDFFYQTVDRELMLMIHILIGPII